MKPKNMTGTKTIQNVSNTNNAAVFIIAILIAIVPKLNKKRIVANPANT